MATSLDGLIADMMLKAPDPNEELPVSNRPETIWGATVPFLVVTWLAVLMRFWVRLRIMREPGWDDALVVLAAILNTVATALVISSIQFGLGHHFLYLQIPQMQGYIKFFYLANSTYITNTAVIKLSLLTQYLRIFKAGTMNWVCKSLFAIIAAWGCTYSFMSWVPCFPPQAYWNRNAYPNAICYGFGFSDIQGFVSLFESHSALNMVFDLTVFITPMIIFTKPNLRMKSIVAMSGIFILGGIVVCISIWRFYSIVEYKAATRPYIDFTWWSPISIILTCLEIDLAIICASIPIFWPVIEESFAAIFVTREVQITEQPRYSFADHGLTYELEHGDAMRRQHSVKTQSTSRESLVIARESSGEAEGNIALEDHYKDRYLAAQVNPFGDVAQEEGMRVQTNVNARPKDKWVL